MMLNELRPEDQVAIVTYAGSAGEVLAPTAASDKHDDPGGAGAVAGRRLDRRAGGAGTGLFGGRMDGA